MQLELNGLCCMQGKGKGKGKGKASKSSEAEKAANEANSGSGKTEVVKLKALDVFAGCGGMPLIIAWHVRGTPVMGLACHTMRSRSFWRQVFVGSRLIGTDSQMTHTHTHNLFLALFRDYPGEPVPDENFWTLWCKGRLTQADTPTIRLGATPSGLSSAHLHHPHCFYRPDALPAAQPTVSKH